MTNTITQSTTVSAASLKAFEEKYSAWKTSSDSTKSLNRELANIFDWRLYVSPRGKNKALALLNTTRRYDRFTRKLDDILARVRGDSWTSKTDDARKKDLGGYISDWRLTALEQQDFDLYDATDGKLEFINLQKVDGKMVPAANKTAINAAKKKKDDAKNKAPQQPIAPKTPQDFAATGLQLTKTQRQYIAKYGKDVATTVKLDIIDDLLKDIEDQWQRAVTS